MWIGRFKIFHENCVNLRCTRKYRVIDSLYPLNHYVEDGSLHISFVHLLSGEEKEKAKFIQDYASDARVVEIEQEGTDCFVSHVKTRKDDRHTFVFYDRRLFFIRPVVHTDVEDWLLGSWNKEYLEQFYSQLSKFFEIRYVSIKREKAPGIFMPNLAPSLTRKQKEALELASAMGYYDYPRHAYLEDIAKKLGITRIALQERLHKAEGKIIPRLLKQE